VIPHASAGPWPRHPGSGTFPPHYVVPGDIPGLLCPCAPVIHRQGWGGIVYDSSGLGGRDDVHVAGSGCGMGGSPPARIPRSDLALVLDWPIGRVIAQAWLWPQLAGSQQHTPLYTVIPRDVIVELATHRAHDAEWWTPARMVLLVDVVHRLAGRGVP